MRRPYLKMQLDGDPRYELILLALKNANSLFRTLFSAGAWLDGAQAREVGEQGLLLLRCYWNLAKLSLEKKEPRYPIHPKFHMLYHHFDFFFCWHLLRKVSSGSNRHFAIHVKLMRVS